MKRIIPRRSQRGVNEDGSVRASAGGVSSITTDCEVDINPTILVPGVLGIRRAVLLTGLAGAELAGEPLAAVIVAPLLEQTRAGRP